MIPLGVPPAFRDGLPFMAEGRVKTVDGPFTSYESFCGRVCVSPESGELVWWSSPLSVRTCLEDEVIIDRAVRPRFCDRFAIVSQKYIGRVSA